METTIPDTPPRTWGNHKMHSSCRSAVSAKQSLLAANGRFWSFAKYQGTTMIQKRFPRAINPHRVGKYPAESFAGGGYVWDGVLEYRVWCCPAAGALDEDNGNDYYFAFANYPQALQFSQNYEGADDPIALVLQLEYIDEPKQGKYVHVKRRRVTEWPVEFLARPKRNKHTIPEFFSPTAPENRLEILRGLAKKTRRSTQTTKVASPTNRPRRHTKP